MIIILSPAKKMDSYPFIPELKVTSPHFLDRSAMLVSELRKLDVDALSRLMKVSDKLAQQNVQRYQTWQTPFTLDNAHPALFTFSGDAFVGLDAPSLTPLELTAAQHQLRILSGLYGILRPLDLMQPYRLEMGGRFSPPGAANLNGYWKKLLTDRLHEEIRTHETPYLINLASDEYSNAINLTALECPVITPRFLDSKSGKYKVISSFAKKARGMMARWVIKEQASSSESLLEFSDAGYRYCPERSQPDAPAFVRGDD